MDNLNQVQPPSVTHVPQPLPEWNHTDTIVAPYTHTVIDKNISNYEKARRMREIMEIALEATPAENMASGLYTMECPWEKTELGYAQWENFIATMHQRDETRKGHERLILEFKKRRDQLVTQIAQSEGREGALIRDINMRHLERVERVLEDEKLLRGHPTTAEEYEQQMARERTEHERTLLEKVHRLKQKMQQQEEGLRILRETATSIPNPQNRGQSSLGSYRQAPSQQAPSQQAPSQQPPPQQPPPQQPPPQQAPSRQGQSQQGQSRQRPSQQGSSQGQSSRQGSSQGQSSRQAPPPPPPQPSRKRQRADDDDDDREDAPKPNDRAPKPKNRARKPAEEEEEDEEDDSNWIPPSSSLADDGEPPPTISVRLTPEEEKDFLSRIKGKKQRAWMKDNMYRDWTAEWGRIYMRCRTHVPETDESRRRREEIERDRAERRRRDDERLARYFPTEEARRKYRGEETPPPEKRQQEQLQQPAPALAPVSAPAPLTMPVLQTAPLPQLVPERNESITQQNSPPLPPSSFSASSQTAATATSSLMVIYGLEETLLMEARASTPDPGSDPYSPYLSSAVSGSPDTATSSTVAWGSVGPSRPLLSNDEFFPPLDFD